VTGSKSQGQHPAKLKQPQRSEPDPIGWWAMVLCALAVGTIAGFHNLMFLGGGAQSGDFTLAKEKPSFWQGT